MWIAQRPIELFSSQRKPTLTKKQEKGPTLGSKLGPVSKVGRQGPQGSQVMISDRFIQFLKCMDLKFLFSELFRA